MPRSSVRRVTGTTPGELSSAAGRRGVEFGRRTGARAGLRADTTTDRETPGAPAASAVPPAIVPASSAGATSVLAARVDDGAPRARHGDPVARRSERCASERASARARDARRRAGHGQRVQRRRLPSRWPRCVRRCRATARRTRASTPARRTRCGRRSTRVRWDVRLRSCVRNALPSTIATSRSMVRVPAPRVTVRRPMCRAPAIRVREPSRRAWRFTLEKGRDANWQIASAQISVPPASTRGR